MLPTGSWEAIQNRVGTERSGGGNRKEEEIMTRLGKGHSNLNRIHIIGRHPTGLCERCQVPETLEHVLVNCRKYTSERKDMI